LLKQGAAMIVTGKGFGETNFIALDGAGSPLAQSLIRVVVGRSALLVQRGLDRQSYSCAPQVYQPRSLATMSNILAMSQER
jgi:Pilus formation protein N terminal region